MPIDANIALQAKPVQIENPLAQYANFLTAQHAQNQNALFPLQMQQMEMANKQKQQQFDMIAPILSRMAGGGSSAGGAPGNALTAGMPQAGAPAGNALAGNPQGIPTNDGIPYSLSDLGALAAAGYPGAKEMLEVKKTAMQGQKFDPKSTYLIGGKLVTMPELDPGTQMGPNGVIGEIPGYSATHAAIKGTESAAVEGAKPLPLGYVGQDGRPLGGTVGQYLGQPQPGAAPAPSAPPAPAAPGPQGLDLSKLTPAQIAFLQKKDPQAFANGAKDFQQTNAPAAAPTDPAQYEQKRAKAIADISAFTSQQEAIASLKSHMAAGDVPPEQGMAIMQSIPQDPSQFHAWQVGMLRNIANSGAPGAAPAPAAPANGRPVLQSATEAAEAAAAVKMKTEPALMGATKTAEGAAAAGQVYQTELHKKVDGSRELVRRNNTIEPLLDQFQTGGFTPELRLKLGSEIANTGWLPDGLKKSIGTMIASGDPTAGKLIENQLAAAGVSNMLQVLDKEATPNRAIFNAVHAAQEGLKTGNTTLKDVFKIQKMIYEDQFAEQQALTGAIKKGTYDPRTWQGDYSAVQNDQLGKAPPAGGATGATPAQKVQSAVEKGVPSKLADAPPVAVKTAADYAKLPSGTVYTAPDGSQRVKK